MNVTAKQKTWEFFMRFTHFRSTKGRNKSNTIQHVEDSLTTKQDFNIDIFQEQNVDFSVQGSDFTNWADAIFFVQIPGEQT